MGDGYTARDEAVGESLGSGFRSPFPPWSVAQRPYTQGVTYLSLTTIPLPNDLESKAQYHFRKSTQKNYVDRWVRPTVEPFGDVPRRVA